MQIGIPFVVSESQFYFCRIVRNFYAEAQGKFPIDFTLAVGYHIDHVPLTFPELLTCHLACILSVIVHMIYPTCGKSHHKFFGFNSSRL